MYYFALFLVLMPTFLIFKIIISKIMLKNTYIKTENRVYPYTRLTQRKALICGGEKIK